MVVVDEEPRPLTVVDKRRVRKKNVMMKERMGMRCEGRIVIGEWYVFCSSLRERLKVEEGGGDEGESTMGIVKGIKEYEVEVIGKACGPVNKVYFVNLGVDRRDDIKK